MYQNFIYYLNIKNFVTKIVYIFRKNGFNNFIYIAWSRLDCLLHIYYIIYIPTHIRSIPKFKYV